MSIQLLRILCHYLHIWFLQITDKHLKIGTLFFLLSSEFPMALYFASAQCVPVN